MSCLLQSSLKCTQSRHIINEKNKLHVSFFSHQLCFRELFFNVTTYYYAGWSVGCIFSAPVCKEIKLVIIIFSFILLSPEDYISITADTWSRHLGNTPALAFSPSIDSSIYLFFFFLFIATLNLENHTLGVPSWCLACDHHPPAQPIPPSPWEGWRLWPGDAVSSPALRLLHQPAFPPAAAAGSAGTGASRREQVGLPTSWAAFYSRSLSLPSLPRFPRTDDSLPENVPWWV